MGLCKIGFAEPNTLWNYLVQYDNTNLRSIIYSQFDNNIMLTWFETNERSHFITHASSVAPGHVGTWQTSHAGHSKETYFNMVKTYYGQSAYDLLIQRYLNNTRTYLDSFGIAEWHPPVGGHGIYGSSRLGIYQSNLNLVTQRFDADVSNGSFEDPENISTTTFEPSYNFYTLQRGNKRYELSNHLGNVLTVITDKCILSCIGDTVSAKTADIVSATDYSPFGAPLAGRVFSSSVFRYGFNGKENDNEVKGDGGQQDYGFRIYDPRKARFLSVDPLTTSYPWYTPYQFAGNMPIWAIDLDGLEEAFATDYCDEKTGIYKRIYVLNPSAKTKDLGVIQFKYCDGNSKNV